MVNSSLGCIDMNKRIEELADQCNWQEVVVEDGEEWIHAHFDKQKFAELIVKECAKVAVHNPDGLWYTGTDAGLVSAGRMTAAQLIKEHFGVEE